MVAVESGGFLVIGFYYQGEGFEVAVEHARGGVGEQGGGEALLYRALSYRFRPKPQQRIFPAMTELLDRAVERARALAPAAQDEIARVVLQLAGEEEPKVVLSEDEREAIARSQAAAGRGEFATAAQVRAVWAKHGL